MSKRKLEDDLEDDWKAPDIVSGIKKNSLDSDEEDDVEGKNYEIMADDDIEGQEEGAVGFDGEVQITPFNMREEMEEGHFDTEGNYHWKKDGKVVRDNWLENIDWVKIKKQDGPSAEANDNDSDSGDSSIGSPFDQIPVYKQMLDLMKPGETVAKSLQRLGGKKTMSVSERWRRKKEGLLDETDSDNQKVTELTELANRLLTKTGNMDVYQETYQHINSLIKLSEKKPVKSYDDALDMYADDFDEKEKARISQSTMNSKHKLDEAEGSGENEPPSKRLKNDDGDAENKEENSSTTALDKDAEVQWEFKWKKESSDVHGPHSTTQMQAWVDEGYFKEPVWVRRVGQEGPFYTSHRVDFELYL